MDGTKRFTLTTWKRFFHFDIYQFIIKSKCFTLKICSSQVLKHKMLYETQLKEKTSSTKQFMVIASFLLLFFCDRSSRWDSELRAQLPWEPNSRGNWTPVGGRTRRAKRGGSCQGWPDSSHHVGLQRVFIKRLTMALFPYRTSHRSKTWRKIVTAVNVAGWTKHEIYIIARIFPGTDGLVRVYFFLKVSVIECNETMEKFKLCIH